MNPFAYPPRSQAKAIVGALTALGTGLAAGDPVVAVVGALIGFYSVFAVSNGEPHV